MKENMKEEENILRQILISHTENMSYDELSDLLKYIESKDNSDRRNYTRYDCDLPVSIKIIENSSIDHNKNITGLIKNISLGGMFIETNNEFFIGNHLDLSFKIPDNEYPIEAKGKVVRNNFSGIGVKFDISDIHTDFTGSIYCYINQGLDIRDGDDYI